MKFECEKIECPKCANKFVVKEFPSTIYGEVSYMGLQAVCPKCGHTEFFMDVHEEELKRIDKAIREYRGLVSYEDTLKLPRKYGISRDYLDVVLDLDVGIESDFIDMSKSIWDGEMPTSAESERIRNALESPKYFLERLEMAKDKLPMEKYEKVHNRVLRMK